MVGQEDQSQIQIIYQALINLIPQEINCSVETGTCYDNLVSKLSDIRQSEDIEYNRQIWKEILEVIALTDTMTSEQKLDFRAILISLVYRGNIDAIPEAEKQDIIENTPTGTGGWLPIFSLLINIGIWAGIIFWVFLTVLLVLYIIYRARYSERDDVTFQQFITRNTDPESKVQNVSEDIEDILGEIIEPEKNDILSFSKEEKVIQGDPLNTPQTHTNIKTQKDIETPWEKTSPEQVPDWLKGSFASTKKSDPIVQKIATPSGTEEKIPRSLTDVSIKKEKISSPIVSETPPEDFEKNALPEDSNVPDWLKGSFTPEKTENITTVIQENTQKAEEIDTWITEDKGEKIHKDEEKIPSSEPEELRIPDWLKGADLSGNNSQNTPLEDTVTQSEVEEMEKISQTEKKEVIAPVRKQRSKTETQKEQAWNTPVSKKQKSSKESPNADNTSKNTEELWDDGMKIPDWLKWGDDVSK